MKPMRHIAKQYLILHTKMIKYHLDKMVFSFLVWDSTLANTNIVSFSFFGLIRVKNIKLNILMHPKFFQSIEPITLSYQAT
jgi:hypothetical protein